MRLSGGGHFIASPAVPLLAMTQEVLYLSREDVESVGLSMAGVVDAVEAVFREKGEGNVEMPPKPGIHPVADSFIHAMPAYVPGMQAAGMKWVSGFPSNLKRGLPHISGLLIMNDPVTGIPTGIMDATWVTAKRTGAATAEAAVSRARRLQVCRDPWLRRPGPHEPRSAHGRLQVAGAREGI